MYSATQIHDYIGDTRSLVAACLIILIAILVLIGAWALKCCRDHEEKCLQPRNRIRIRRKRMKDEMIMSIDSDAFGDMRWKFDSVLAAVLKKMKIRAEKREVA